MDVEQFRAVIFKNFMLRLQASDDEESQETGSYETELDEKETPEMQLMEDVCD